MLQAFEQLGAQESARTEGGIVPKGQVYISYSNDQDSLQTENKLQDQKLKKQTQEIPDGFTRFTKLSYYKQYFQINEDEVSQRIQYTIKIPYRVQFTEMIKIKPDFYGPFWILTTLVILLGFVQNFSNYILSKVSTNEQFNQYFFSLGHVRQAITLMYTFGLGVPVAIYFILQFTRTTQNSQAFPELPVPNIICLYGYSIFSYIPALILCILPVSSLQWLFIVAAFANSTIFLVLNLQKYIQGVKQVVVIVLISAMQLILMLCIKLIFVNIKSA